MTETSAPNVGRTGVVVVFLDPYGVYGKKASTQDLYEALGFIPDFLLAGDYKETNAWDQLDSCYAHGGGCHEFTGFEVLEDNSILYPGDPPLHPLARYELDNGEVVWQYPHAWIRVGDRITRMD